MKKIIFIVVLLVAVNLVNAQIEINSICKVGIKSTPSTVYDVTLGGWNFFSGNVGIRTPPSAGYVLNVSGGSRFTEVGIGTSHATGYALNVAGVSLFTGTSNFVGTMNLFNALTTPLFTITANSGAAPGLWLKGNANYLMIANGNISCVQLFQSSDEKLKKNIREIDGSEILTKLTTVSGRKYQFKSKTELSTYYTTNSKDASDYSKSIPNFSTEETYGLLAQELEVEFPELVKTDELTGLKAINYVGMIPILLEAIKTQQQTINELNERVTSLTTKKIIKSSSKTGANSDLDSYLSDDKTATSDNTGNSLSQNVPNPFTENTIIAYNIGENAQNAMICIYNMNGNQLKCYTLRGSGQGSITINGNELTAGMYMYSLIVDNQLIDTKRMILTE